MKEKKKKLLNSLLKNSYVNVKENFKNILVCCGFQIGSYFITLRKSIYGFS